MFLHYNRNPLLRLTPSLTSTFLYNPLDSKGNKEYNFKILGAEYNVPFYSKVEILPLSKSYVRTVVRVLKES